MKKFLCVFLPVSLFFLLTGCKKQNTSSAVRVVTGITVTATTGESTVTRTYTQDRNMSYILNYLRLLDPYVSVALSPDTFRSDTYQIRVNYSDGGHTQYNQIYHDYFQTENGAWKRIDPKLGSGLQKIINELSDDI